MNSRFVLSFVGLTTLTFSVYAGESPSEGVEFFETKIRPILIDNCFSCHSTGKKQKANLLLDSRAGMLLGGDSGAAIVPGKPEQSRLLRAVGYDDEVLKMPPKAKLPDSVIADLAKWVKMGAPWPEGTPGAPAVAKAAFDMQERRKHWAWQPIKSPALPTVKQLAWPANSIDYFVLAGLEAAGLAPAQPADKRTLLRRVTYDLIGFPPTPAEIDAFLSDESPRAYEKVVDRLLASSHYGERWGRHWLDLVRYAETYGHEFDFEIPDPTPYRDYVIRALNTDLPYDRFVTEHIAGDLLPQPRKNSKEGFNESIIGTAFWFLGESVHSPVDVRADEADRCDNQIDVFAKTFLGLTVSCARCHDHKFDAISTKDYYALMGFLESSRLQRAFVDPPEKMQPTLDRLTTVRQKIQTLATNMTAARLGTGLKDPSKLKAKLTNLSPDHPLYPLSLLCRTEKGLVDKEFAAKRQETRDRHAARRSEPPDQVVMFEDFRKPGFPDWYVTGTAFGTTPVMKPELLLTADPAKPARRVVGGGTAHSGTVSDKLQGVLRSRSFTISKKKILYHVAGRKSQINLIIDGFQLIREPIYGGMIIHVESGDRPEWRVQDVSLFQGQRAYIEIIDDGPGFIEVDKILFSDGGPPSSAPNTLVMQILDDNAINSSAALTDKCRELLTQLVELWRSGQLAAAKDLAARLELLNWLIQSDLANGEPGHEVEKLKELLADKTKIENAIPQALRSLAIADGTPWNEPVHIRGNHKNLGPEVSRRFLEAIAGAEQPVITQGSGRLELAKRLLDPANPLPARVMVNRLWKHHFGEGLVRSPDNFGLLGETPTHPELLDYLAGRFRAEGWSMKKMHRLMLLSQAYQMASRSDEASETRDPQNRLLHRMPVRRLEAEIIRDAILAVSGRLDPAEGGPSIPPYLTPHMAGKGRPEKAGPLDGAGRRSIYLNVRRNFLPPMLTAFDYPTPFTTIGQRSVANVPAQALTLMNNPFVIQQAELWARRALSTPGLTPRQRIENMYTSAFGRPPTEIETGDALTFLQEQSKSYGHTEDPKAWADLCHVLFNVKEFIFIN